MKKILQVFLWIGIALLGSFAYWILAFKHNEPLNAIWILTAALCTYSIGYRFYSKWIAATLLTLNDQRLTPSEINEDGRDFVKTNKWIVFGHHFAAISGPGPLVGPVLAAQFGYLPGTLWILIGVVLGGAVQDFIILFSSTRRNGKSLGEMVKEEIGSKAGLIALLAILFILVILIAVLGLVVVKALAMSPWGSFTILATIPIALLMGLYLRYLRPGHVFEVTVMGVGLLLLSVWVGKFFHEVPVLAHLITFSGPSLAKGIIFYGLAASILPVWLLLAPRDYLSTFMKLGTILALAIGLFFVLPTLQLPALTIFASGDGPVFSGKIFPFCFITIACGAMSGFHSLIASGTTPKMISRESHTRMVGYGSMLLESFVAIMALIAACTLKPGIYFAMNTASSMAANPQDLIALINSWGFPISLDEMNVLAKNLGETTLFQRTGGAPTLAVGMASIFSQVMGGEKMMALWYHFVIMFEALFILTTVDAGTRVGRFLLQAFLKHLWKPLGNLYSYRANIFASFLFVSAWGYFLYLGVIDPQGGINSLWPLFGIANQLLSVVALCLGTTILIKMGHLKKIWVTLLPLTWLILVTYSAGLQKIFHTHPQIGFLSQAKKLIAQGGNPQIIFNMRLNAIFSCILLILVTAILIASISKWIKLIFGKIPMDLKESEIVWRDVGAGSKPALFMSAGLEPAATGKTWAENLEIKGRQPRCC